MSYSCNTDHYSIEDDFFIVAYLRGCAKRFCKNYLTYDSLIRTECDAPLQDAHVALYGTARSEDESVHALIKRICEGMNFSSSASIIIETNSFGKIQEV